MSSFKARDVVFIVVKNLFKPTMLVPLDNVLLALLDLLEPRRDARRTQVRQSLRQ